MGAAARQALASCSTHLLDLVRLAEFRPWHAKHDEEDALPEISVVEPPRAEWDQPAFAALRSTAEPVKMHRTSLAGAWRLLAPPTS